MRPPQQAAGRQHLLELKAKLCKLLGPDKESQYFAIFSRFLSHRLSKSELDRQVVLTIGKENVGLHNQIVKAVLYNAACCSEPPLPPSVVPVVTTTSKPIKGVSRRPALRNHHEDALYHPGTRSNGDGVRKPGVRRVKERQALQQQQQQIQQQLFQQQQLLANSNSTSIYEEPSTSQGDVEDLVEHSSSRGENDLRFERPDADSRAVHRSRLILADQQSDGAKVRTPSSNEEDEAECTIWQASPVRAPLGIPPSSTSGRRGPRKHGPNYLLGDGNSLDEGSFLEVADLPDNEGMQRRLEDIAVVDEGLQGVSADCAHLLNQALDVYLKRLIAASIGLPQSRRCNYQHQHQNQQQQHQQQQQLQHHLQQQHHQLQHQHHHQQQQHQHSGGGGSTIELLLKDGVLSTAGASSKNGVWLNHHQQQLQQHQPQLPMVQPLQPHQQQQQQQQLIEKQKQAAPISVLDFKVAMDANPQLLGEIRPLHMERLMLRVFEQQDGPVLQ